MDEIIVKGARENNLKNIDIEIPKNKLVVMKGVSGSGKSSIAFNTICWLQNSEYVCPGLYTTVISGLVLEFIPWNPIMSESISSGIVNWYS